MRIDTDYLEKTLAGLVRINSINPFFTQGEERRTDESAIAAYLAGELERLGMRVTSHEPEPGRVSVVGTLPGTGGGRSLLLYGHMDTVNVEGMAAPFSAEVRDGRMYGRGTYDMKGGLAACVAAAKAVIDSGVRLAGDLSVVGVADEEVASLGLFDLLRTLKADAPRTAAIVTEATELDVCVAHKGFCWFEVETFGRAAHGSRFKEGIDANLRMGRFLGHLDRLERQLRESPGHPLVGPPTLHAATLRGGTGPSTYAAHCRLEVERRTIPGETVEGTLAEMQGILDRLQAEDPAFQGSVRTLLARPAFEVAPEAAIVQAVDRAAAEVLGRRPAILGHTFWMDASLFAEAGIETVVIGPAGAGAHAIEEWVDLDSVAKLADILARAAVAHCGDSTL
jgi:acetylornithine deacetylase